MEFETGESSFEVVRVPENVYVATHTKLEEYDKEKDGSVQKRLKLFFEIENEGEKYELMYTCPKPALLTPATSLGGVLKALGLKEFAENARIDTTVFINRKCKVVVKDWERTENGQKVISSQITDFMKAE